MNVKADDFGAQATQAPVVIEATAAGAVALPEGFAISDAAFAREGADLVLTAPDGERIVVTGYFAQENPPALATPDGAQISGAMAERLAGPMAPGQVAAAGDTPASDAGAEAIGKVTSVDGRAFVVRADGTRVELSTDTPVYPGDILETGADGLVGVVLADETTFSMGNDGRMVLDEMIYDPESQEGSLSMLVVKGVYTFVSGMVSKTDPDAMTIETPIGTIGIRGTQVGLDLSDGKDLTVVMMEETDGYVGEVFITNAGGVQVMNQAHQVLFVGAFDREPVFMPSVDASGVVEMFGPTLRFLPTPTGRENHYEVTDARPGAEELDAFQTDAGETAPPEGEEEAAPAETIRVVEGDYTEQETLEPVTPPPPEELVPAGTTPEAPATEERRDEETLVAEETQPPAAAEPAPAPPVLSVAAASGPEDTAIPLSVTLVEGTAATVALTVSGVPEGATLSAGTDNGDGTWTLSGDDLETLNSLTLTPPADWSGEFDLSLTATAADGLETQAGFGVSVASVPDLPIIGVSAVSGAEDAPIPLSITADVPGTEELASVIISGVPEGAQLSAGGDNGDGTWTLAGADLEQLETLTLTPPADWSGEIALSVEATSSDGGTATAGFGIQVAGVADLPILSVTGAQGLEDHVIPLSVSASVPGTETLASLTISGVPAGALLSAGTDNGDGTWTLEGTDLENLDSLTLTPAADWSGDAALSVTATSTDGGTASAQFGVSVTAVPDQPVIAASGVSGAEDAAIPLDVSALVPGTEQLAQLTIEGVPEGAVLSAGTDNGDGTWTLSGDDLDQLDGLTLTPPADSSADMTLTVKATSTDGGTATAAFTVAVAAVADTPELQVADATVDVGGSGPPGDDVLEGGEGADVLVGGAGNDVLEGGEGADVLYGDSDTTQSGPVTVPLDIQAALADTDASESLSIAVAGVPEGATLSAGTDNGDGSWTLAPDELDGLDLTLPEGHQGDFQLQVTATATDVDVDTGAADEAAATGVIDVTVTGGGAAGDDVLSGGEGDDVLYGGGGADVLEGGEGHDVLHGGAGNDILEGGEGHDVLYGGGGADVLEGGEGADIIEGGAGDDVILGGGGHDVFVFKPGAGKDIIEDFREGETLRFEGPEFSEENLTVSQDGNGVRIAFGDQDVEVTLNDVALSDQSYSVTQDGDALVITFDETD